ncbi:MAG: TolC family protein [Planctomycetota bacterium]
MCLRTVSLIGVSGIVCMVFAGCASVDPCHDYERTSRMVAERTGIDEVYEPGIEPLIGEKISSLLADGLTIDEAVQVAMLNKPGFQALFAAIGASRADVVQSTLLTNPTFSLSARLPEGGGRSNLSYGLGQELVDLWQIPVRKRVAEAELEQTVLEVVRQGVALAAEARSRYHRLAALEQAIEIGTENLHLAEQSLALAESRLKAGETGQLDVNLLKANVLAVQISLIELKRDRDVARAALSRTLGLARSASPWTLSPSAEPLPSSLPSEQALIVHAMRERPDARIAAERVRAAEEEARRQCLNVFQHVEIGVDGERPERRALPGRKVLADTARASLRNGALTAPDIETRAERNLERRQIIDSLLGPSVAITLPIWDQNQAQIAKASYKAQQSRKEYEDLLDDVARQVQEAQAIAEAAAELSRFFEEQALPQAEANLGLARKSYEAGEQGIVILIEAQESLIAQRLAAVSIDRDYRIAVVELELAVGGRLPAADAIESTSPQPTATQPIAVSE